MPAMLGYIIAYKNINWTRDKLSTFKKQNLRYHLNLFILRIFVRFNQMNSYLQALINY